ncbi:MAG: hypothetical protein ABI640_02935 [Gammaproteobacteria bacterium]
MALRRIALACHAALILLIAAAALAGGITLASLCVAAAIVAPLLIALHALLTRRGGATRWTTVLLVPYAGALSVEVVARAGASPILSAGLLISVLELGLLLALIRSSGPSAVRE